MYNAAFLEQSLPNIAVYVLDSIDSTSAFLKRRSAEILKSSLCVTHQQVTCVANWPKQPSGKISLTQ